MVKLLYSPLGTERLPKIFGPIAKSSAGLIFQLIKRPWLSIFCQAILVSEINEFELEKVAVPLIWQVAGDLRPPMPKNGSSVTEDWPVGLGEELKFGSGEGELPLRIRPGFLENNTKLIPTNAIKIQRINCFLFFMHELYQNSKVFAILRFKLI